MRGGRCVEAGGLLSALARAAKHGCRDRLCCLAPALALPALAIRCKERSTMWRGGGGVLLCSARAGVGGQITRKRARAASALYPFWLKGREMSGV